MRNSGLVFFTDSFPAFTELLYQPARKVFAERGYRATFDQQLNKLNKMKTINTLTAIFFTALSLNTFAGNPGSENSNDKPKSLVIVSPFVLGNPDDEAPEEIRLVKAKYAHVPLAPFVWGDPSDIPAGDHIIKDIKKMNVPLAPFVWGNADEQAPELLKFIIAVNADVPLAPFVWGSPDDAAPEL